MRIERRKGISYILEVAMMTLVVVALASVVLTWGLGQVSNSRIALTGAVNDRINRSQETTNIEDVQMLTSTTMRVYVRNTGAIQVLIDAVYVNNANTPVLGTCPSGSFQAGTYTISSSISSIPITFTTSEPNALYSVTLSTSWGASPTATAGSLLATGFTITLGSAQSSGSVTWYTNYASCASASSSVKLNLAINAVGALDVTVSPAPNTVASGTAASGSTSTTLQGSFGASNYANDVVWITSGAGSGQCRTVSSNTASALTVSSAWTIIPVGGSSAYSISSSASTGPPVCSGNSYTVTASTNRGTTVTGSFTV